MKKGFSPLRRGPFLFLRAPSALRNRPLPEQRVHFSSSYSFSGKTPLFPLRYAVKQKQYGIFRAQPLRFPHAQPQGEAGLSGRTPAFHTTGGRNAPCRKHKKKKTAPERTVLVFSGVGLRYLACSLSTSIIFFCGLIMQASMNSWISESDFRMDLAVFWVLRFQASSQMMKPLASSGSSA